jgi:hypothetical protein
VIVAESFGDGTDSVNAPGRPAKARMADYMVPIVVSVVHPELSKLVLVSRHFIRPTVPHLRSETGFRPFQK